MQDRGAVVDESTFAVLNALTIKKIATPKLLAEVTGLPESDVARALAALEEQGAAFQVDASVLATDEATTMVKTMAETAYAGLRDDAATERWHARFEPLNRQFLKAVTAWQTVDVAGSKLPNDHSDSAYDEKTLTKIGAIVDRMGGLLQELGASVPRLLRYRDRLKAALDKTYAGDTRFVSDVAVDSIHGIWFEMHEDVLLVLGKERNDAGG